MRFRAGGIAKEHTRLRQESAASMLWPQLAHLKAAANSRDTIMFGQLMVDDHKI